MALFTKEQFAEVLQLDGSMLPEFGALIERCVKEAGEQVDWFDDNYGSMVLAGLVHGSKRLTDDGKLVDATELMVNREQVLLVMIAMGIVREVYDLLVAKQTEKGN